MAIHFVWFRGDEYLSAVRVWGEPDFIHMGWDSRAKREIADGDTVVFAKGASDQPFYERVFSDTKECERLRDFDRNT
jgi:hypothetical protein